MQPQGVCQASIQPALAFPGAQQETILAAATMCSLPRCKLSASWGVDMNI